MAYSENELKSIQKIEMDILIEVQKICIEENIEFFLIGGTALGAIRHEGFIPWDDDIDVAMTRENYDRFIQIAPDKLSDKYFLQSITTEKNTPYPYCKIRDNTGSEYIEYCNRNLNIHNGIYIDIFPFDEVPDNENLNIKQYNKVMKYAQFFSFRNTPDISNRPEKLSEICKFVVRRLIHYIFLLFPRNYINIALEKEMTKYNNSNQQYLAGLFFPKRKVEYIAKIDLYPLVYKLFEGKEMPIANNWDKYLKTHYGDYMKYPPIEQRFGHKPYRIKINA